MQLTIEQEEMLAGKSGQATRKAMEILFALGTIYGADRMVPVTSVQIAGVSFDNLGEAGLQFLSEMADGGGKARVLTTLNPAGMDLENWPALGISPEFACDQQRVIDAFSRMGVVTTCTCTPYLAGNLPHYGERLAWAESSAVCYANSVIGARTNREGGPSALAAALTGCTPSYGLHLDENRFPSITIIVDNFPATQSPENYPQHTHLYGALGKLIGEKIESFPVRRVPYIRGVSRASLEELKSFCASVATYGGVALFHMEGITPEAAL
jgi:predicted aconitase